jgi:hypothetical protein
MTTTKIEFSETTKSAMRDVANYIAAEFNPTPELVLDRLGFFGHKAASEEVSALIKTHGYAKVERATRKVI